MNATTLLKTWCSHVVLVLWQLVVLCFCWRPLVSRCGSAVGWQPLCVFSHTSLYSNFYFDHVLLENLFVVSGGFWYGEGPFVVSFCGLFLYVSAVFKRISKNQTWKSDENYILVTLKKENSHLITYYKI